MDRYSRRRTERGSVSSNRDIDYSWSPSTVQRGQGVQEDLVGTFCLIFPRAAGARTAASAPTIPHGPPTPVTLLTTQRGAKWCERSDRSFTAAACRRSRETP